MKAQELRIGNQILMLGIDYDSGDNKFHDPNGDEVYTVDMLILKNVMNSPENYDGIPLTEEWLYKFGFYTDSPLLFHPNSFIKYHRGIKIIMVEDIELDHIKYVHEIQNLYFALTGEELEVKNV